MRAAVAVVLLAAAIPCQVMWVSLGSSLPIPGGFPSACLVRDTTGQLSTTGPLAVVAGGPAVIGLHRFSGSGWILVTTVGGSLSIPPGVGLGAAAFDSSRNRVVVWLPPSGSTAGVTLETDGTYWSNASGSQSPGGDGPLAYDAARSRCVLVKGAETWTLNGAGWSRLNVVGTPPAGDGGALAYNPQRGRVMLLRTAGFWELDASLPADRTPSRPSW